MRSECRRTTVRFTCRPYVVGCKRVLGPHPVKGRPQMLDPYPKPGGNAPQLLSYLCPWFSCALVKIGQVPKTSLLYEDEKERGGAVREAYWAP